MKVYCCQVLMTVSKLMRWKRNIEVVLRCLDRVNGVSLKIYVEICLWCVDQVYLAYLESLVSSVFLGWMGAWDFQVWKAWGVKTAYLEYQAKEAPQWVQTFSFQFLRCSCLAGVWVNFHWERIMFNPFTAMLAAQSLKKTTCENAKFEIIKALFSHCMSTWKDFYQNAQDWK